MPVPPDSSSSPPDGPLLALGGRLVSMDAAFTVIQRGTLYLDNGIIVAAQDARKPPPAGFEAVVSVPTGGTIYPGLIDLHNHLSYNVLPVWQVPRIFSNRDQWGRTADYQRLVTGPMTILGERPELLAAVARYAECKCLLAGTTTTQGIALFSNQGARRYYRGLVRNVEQTADAGLPEAATRIADVDAADATAFRARVLRETCLLLHLSEGTDEAAREHFLALQLSPGQWALGPALAGIHCAALTASDFDVMTRQGASMIWSPLSNLLLYGATARIKEARAAGVRIGIGPDWSVSGSKNLLGELKVARLVSQEAGGVFSDRELVAMATRDAAAILKWDAALGSLEPGKRADLLVLDSVLGDPYEALLRASESSIHLVLIDGVPRFGAQGLMRRLGASGESVSVAGRRRTLSIDQAPADPAVPPISLREARRTLARALKNLPELARQRERALRTAPPGRDRWSAMTRPPVWFLALDELAETGMDLRPRLALGPRLFTGPALGAGLAQLSLPAVLQPLPLDELTVADDARFLDQLAGEKNLPLFVARGLQELY